MKRAENSSEPVEEDEEDDESLFIPLSLPLLREGQRYTDEDPEWQTFLKYSKDEKSLSYLKEQLAYDIAKALSSDLNITALVGTPKTVSSSLRHEFPARAPPKYVRHGLDLSEDYTGLVIKALDVEDGDRIWNLLEPYRAISTFLLTTHIYLLMKRSRLQNRLNQSRYVYPSQNEQSVNATVPTLTTPFLPGVPGSVGKLPELDSRAAETKSDNVKRSPFQPLIIKDESTKGGLDKANTFTLDIIIAAKIFLFLLEQRRTRYLTPPPGVFIIEGMVTVTGTEGQCHVYTKALFDPKKRHFNTFVHVRSVLSFLNKPSTKQ
ncbi:hypothetical protein FQN49_006596 [Arthroderma sp. PD_2]|nr:hypothetical protein FQN49_006596 [Arthroderma sp. PD_2]